MKIMLTAALCLLLSGLADADNTIRFQSFNNLTGVTSEITAGDGFVSVTGEVDEYGGQQTTHITFTKKHITILVNYDFQTTTTTIDRKDLKAWLARNPEIAPVVASFEERIQTEIIGPSTRTTAGSCNSELNNLIVAADKMASSCGYGGPIGAIACNVAIANYITARKQYNECLKNST